MPKEQEEVSVFNMEELQRMLAGWDSIDQGLGDVEQEDIRGELDTRTRANTQARA